MSTANEQYTCAHCQQTFLKGTPDEEANEEALALFGVENASTQTESMSIVCDDCFQKMSRFYEWNPGQNPEYETIATTEIDTSGLSEAEIEWMRAEIERRMKQNLSSFWMYV